MKTISIKTITSLLFAGLLLTACNSSETNEQKADEHGHEEHGAENVVTLTQQQIKAIDLTLTQVEEKNMSTEIQVNGTLEIPPQHKADISPVMGGIVKKIYVIEGDKVRKGQTLATLQHPDFITLQSDYNTNINNFEFVEQDYLRQQKLNQEKVVSNKSFQKITAEYKNLKSTINAQKIQLQMLGISASGVAEGKIYSTVNITAPFNGYVSVVETNVGAFVEPMSKLFEVVNSDELHADFMVYEKDITKIAVGQKIVFTTSSIGQEFEAEIHNISPVFEENPKALHIHADIKDEKNSLIPGMYISGRILADNILSTVVPNDALVLDDGKYYIFVKQSNLDNHQNTHKSQDAHNHSEAQHSTHNESNHNHDSEHEADEDHTNHTEDHNHKSETKKWSFEKTEVIVGETNGAYTTIKFLGNFNLNAKIAGNGAYFMLSEMTKEENEHEH